MACLNFIPMASGMSQDMTISPEKQTKKPTKHLFFKVLVIVTNAFLLKEVKPCESRQK